MNFLSILASIFGAIGSLFSVADHNLNNKEIDRLEKRNETLYAELKKSEKEKLLVGALLAMSIIFGVITFFHCGAFHA